MTAIAWGAIQGAAVGAIPFLATNPSSPDWQQTATKVARFMFVCAVTGATASVSPHLGLFALVLGSTALLHQPDFPLGNGKEESTTRKFVQLATSMFTGLALLTVLQKSMEKFGFEQWINIPVIVLEPECC